MLDLDAPIVPGYAAAGLTIGAPASGVTEAPKGATALPNGALRLDYDSVSIWVHGEKIVRICLRERYRGLLDGALGIGSAIAEVEAYAGPVVEDEEGNLAVAGSSGWSFGAGDWSEALTIEENRDARITWICVHR